MPSGRASALHGCGRLALHYSRAMSEPPATVDPSTIRRVSIVAKYEINQEFDGFGDVRQYDIEADDYQLENGYFDFYNEGVAVLTIATKEVYTIRRKVDA